MQKRKWNRVKGFLAIIYNVSNMIAMNLKIISFFSLMMLLGAASGRLSAQSAIPRDSIIFAGQELMKQSSYCALITIDSTGLPQARTMNPFPAGDDFVIWFATSRTSRKVKDIRHNPNVCVYWSDHVNTNGYVSVNGTAEVIDDKKLLVEKKRAYWDGIKGWQDQFVLIRIVPKSMIVVNYKHNLINDPNTFGAPGIQF